MDDIAKRLRSEADAWDDGSGHMAALMREAAAEIERLRLYERYANSYVQGQVEDAIRAKAETGKYPFED